MSPRTQEANDALHGERRKEILDVALRIFVENGFNGTRMQEIAKQCKLSYGLVYHYFPSKEAIFTALVDLALDAAKQLIYSLPQESSPQVFGSLIGFAVSDPSPHYFAIIVEALTKKSVPVELSNRVKQSVLELKTALATAGNGNPRDDNDARAEGILALLLGASIMKICSLSDGSFVAQSSTILAASGKE
jgi:AcrR family transcriptional regulator